MITLCERPHGVTQLQMSTWVHVALTFELTPK